MANKYSPVSFLDYVTVDPDGTRRVTTVCVPNMHNVGSIDETAEVPVAPITDKDAVTPYEVITSNPRVPAKWFKV